MNAAGDLPSRPAGWPMYRADLAATQAWWHGLAAAMGEHGLAGVPNALDEPADAVALDSHWRDPRLLLSQTCGYPLVTRLAGAVRVVGAIRWTADGCEGIDYRSWLVVRGDEPARAIAQLRGRVAAVNDAHSHSGYNALRALVAPLAAALPAGAGGPAVAGAASAGAVAGQPFFARAVATGSHRASLRAVRAGVADVAAIDCVSWAGFRRAAPELLDGLRVIGSSAPAPGLPLITSAATTPAELAALRGALAAACAAPALAAARAALFIGGFEAVEAARWRVIDDLRRAAQAAGCAEL